MNSAPQSRSPVRFGVFELDFAAAELRKRGRRVKLEAQPFQVLCALVRRPGELITREDLRHEIWSADTFVDFDHGLNTAVKKIRAALGDSARTPRYIETAPGQGYRFMAAVDGRAGGLEPAGRWGLRVAVLAAAVFFGAASTIMLWDRGDIREASLTAVQLTAYPGQEAQPSFSPDGSQVAFVWSGEDESNFDVYVQLVGGAAAMRLTDYPGWDTSPAWSPDGRWIAFLRDLGEDRSAVYLVSPLGGHERRVAEVQYGSSPGFCSQLSWSPDSRWLAVVERRSPEEVRGLYLLSIDTGEKRGLTEPPIRSRMDRCPSFSNGGRSLVFSRSFAGGSSELFRLSLDEDLRVQGEPEQLTFENEAAHGAAWTADDRHIVFSGGPKGQRALYRLDVGSKKLPETVYEGADFCQPAISRHGSRLAFANQSGNAGIWRVDLLPREKLKHPPARIAPSSRTDHLPAFSPRGNRIAFVSRRSGNPEIWGCDSGGKQVVQLTSLAGRLVEVTPRWSPDGSRVVLAAKEDGQAEIFAVNSEGGGSERLTSHPATDTWPCWSRDGRRIYFVSDRTGNEQVWRIPAEGGRAVQVTRNGGSLPTESPDGKHLYYLRGQSLWRIPVEGGEETRVLGPVWAGNYAVTPGGIYFTPDQGSPKPDSRPGHSIQFFDFASGDTKEVLKLEQQAMWGFSISPDGGSLLYTLWDEVGGDLMLVEDFR